VFDRLDREAFDRLRTVAFDRLRSFRLRSLVPDRVGTELTVTRRRVLTAVPGAGLVLLAGAASTETAPVASAPVMRVTTRPRTRPTESAHVAPVGKPAQHKPVFTLADYRRITHAPAFPSDAVALTIDDGPHPIWTPKILHLLDHHHVPALFCMIGNQVLGHESVAKTVTRAGHQLANHTWSHPTALAHKPRERVRKEIARAQKKIHDTTGYVPKIFRSPGGDWSPMVLQESARAGLIPLDWSIDPRDWAKPGTRAVERKLLAARPGQILLCHDGGGDRSQTYHALATVIPALKARGLRFVAL
jgi:peptidoglycan/xylan/chitin deacetylase (PgdA/CDA1 family)